MKDFEKSKSCHLHEKHSTTFSFCFDSSAKPNSLCCTSGMLVVILFNVNLWALFSDPERDGLPKNENSERALY